MFPNLAIGAALGTGGVGGGNNGVTSPSGPLSSKRHTYNPAARDPLSPNSNAAATRPAMGVTGHSLLTHQTNVANANGGAGGGGGDRVAALEYEVKRLTDMMSVLSRQVQTLLGEDLKKQNAIARLEEQVRVLRSGGSGSGSSGSGANGFGSATGNNARGSLRLAGSPAGVTRSIAITSPTGSTGSTGSGGGGGKTPVVAGLDPALSAVLAELGMSEYGAAFAAEKVTLRDLSALDSADLQRLVGEVGPRRRLLTRIASSKRGSKRLTAQQNAAINGGTGASTAAVAATPPATAAAAATAATAIAVAPGASPTAAAAAASAQTPAQSAASLAEAKALVAKPDTKALIAMMSGAGAVAAAPPKRSAKQVEELTDDERRVLCLTCGLENRSTQFAPCNHIACCESCAHQTHTCPICGLAVTVNQLSLW